MTRTKTCIALTLLLAASTLPAQTAPVPSQFATAKTAFLASAGAPLGGTKEKQFVAMLYPSMYQALASAHLYQMTSAPAQAELSMTISMESFVTDVTSGNSSGVGFVRLSVYDTRTHTLLWNIDEPMGGVKAKNIDETTSQIVADLKQLASGAVPSNPTTK